MQSPCGEAQMLGQFALVSYIPGPLARFLDELRVDLSPGCKPHAHVTVLPPRTLCHDTSECMQRIADAGARITPFWVELGQVATFEASGVVYLRVIGGASQLTDIYKALNCEHLSAPETYSYLPHVTVAHKVAPERLAEIQAAARERWSRYPGPRGFLVESLSLVQNIAPSKWEDVASVPVGAPLAVGV